MLARGIIMKDFVVGNSLKIIKKSYPDYSNEKMEVLEYGLTGFYMFISKTIIIFTIAYFLGILKELIFFMIIYTAIRSFSFGMHATSSIICLIASALTFLSATYVSTLIILPIWFKVLFGILGIILIFKFSPADTEKKPIVSPKRRAIYKTLSMLIAIIMVICSLIIKDNFISNSCTIALLIQCVMISPLTYKLTNQKYDNYKYYQLN